MVRHSLSGLSSQRFTEEVGSTGMLTNSTAHPPSATCFQAHQMRRNPAQNGPKRFCLALPAQGMERQGGREEKHLFPRLPGMAWSNLALIPNVFPLTAPGTVNLSCYLPLSHKQVQHCNFCLNSVLFAGPYLHWNEQQVFGAQS